MSEDDNLKHIIGLIPSSQQQWATVFLQQLIDYASNNRADIIAHIRARLEREEDAQIVILEALAEAKH